MSGSLSPGGWQFRLSYEISPIVLTGGIAQSMPGGALPILSILQGPDYSAGLLNGVDDIGPDQFFARFRVLPGGTLGEWEFGHYPFANQAVAANAIIFQPLRLSLLMICPATDAVPYSAKQSLITTLRATLAQHTAQGGTFTVATPAFLYTNLLLARLADASDTQSEQPQNAYQWDFEQPLITLAAAQAAQNNLMSKLSNGTQVDASSWSGVSPTVGNPNSLATPSVVPSAAGSPAAGAPSQALPVPPPAPPLGSANVQT
jgi:hypothetical protein